MPILTKVEDINSITNELLNRYYRSSYNQEESERFWNNEHPGEVIMDQIKQTVPYYHYFTNRKMADTDDWFEALRQATDALKAAGVEDVESIPPQRRLSLLRDMSAIKYSSEYRQPLNYAKRYLANYADDIINQPQLNPFWK